MNKIIALLPIKQHSERVPGKNFRDLEGKELFRWMLDTLLACPEISEVVVDTDSDMLISKLHATYPGIKVLLRPDAIRGDKVSMNDVIAYDMSQCPQGNIFLQTHVTNPLISVETLRRAIRCYLDAQDGRDSLFSVNRIQARTYWRDGSPINHVLGKLKRTQDLEPVYEENSCIFIFTPESFKKTYSRIGAAPILFETPPAESLEIDEEGDFEFIRTIIIGRRAR